MDNRTSRFFYFQLGNFQSPKSKFLYLREYNRVGNRSLLGRTVLSHHITCHSAHGSSTLWVGCIVTRQDIVISHCFQLLILNGACHCPWTANLQISSRVFALSHAFDRGIPHRSRFSKQHLTRFHGFLLYARIFRPNIFFNFLNKHFRIGNWIIIQPSSSIADSVFRGRLPWIVPDSASAIQEFSSWSGSWTSHGSG